MARPKKVESKVENIIKEEVIPAKKPIKIEKNPYRPRVRYANYTCPSCGNEYKQMIQNDVIPMGYLCANDKVVMRMEIV